MRGAPVLPVCSRSGPQHGWHSCHTGWLSQACLSPFSQLWKKTDGWKQTT
jgi:hypothetical protein